MRCRFVTAMAFLALCGCAANAAAGSAWTVEDSIGVRYFKPQMRDGSEAPWYSQNHAVASPDGRYFYVVTTRGDLARDVIVDELSVFSAGAVSRALTSGGKAPAPVRTLRLEASSPNDEYLPIARLKWETADTLLFTGTRQKQDRGIYRYSVSNGALQRLSDSTTISGLEFSSFAVFGSSIVYAARPGVQLPAGPLSLERYPFAEVTGHAMKELQLGVGEWNLQRTRLSPYELFAGTAGTAVTSVLRMAAKSTLAGAWPAPNGKQIIVAVAPRDAAPAGWSDYERKPPLAWYRYMRIDLERRTATPIFDAPLGASATPMGNRSPIGQQVFWSKDSTRAILANCALPLTADRENRRRTAYIIEYSFVNDRWSVLEPLETGKTRIRSAGWLKEGESVLVTHESSSGAPAPGTVYSLMKGSGQAKSVTAAVTPRPSAEPELIGGIHVSVRQDANHPPALIASNGARELDLSGQDPALAGKWLARVEPVQWRESDGHMITGGLLQPRERPKTGAPPLVIQLYFYEPQFFRPDGPFSNSFAAQALAAQGMAVLAMDIPSYVASNPANPSVRHWLPSSADTALEYRILMDNLDAAVESLAAAGRIDPDRVGIMGYSRGGYLSHYAVTHPRRTKFAAALAADSITGGYGEYIADIAFADTADEANRIARGTDFQFGGAFWQNKTQWMEESPLFNAGRSQTPMLFALTDLSEWLYALETLAAWRVNRKPFECLMFPEGGHELSRPRERYEAMRATVEWMDFWLRNVEPEDPHRRERWQKLRTEWNAQRAWEGAGNPVGSKPGPSSEIN